MNLKPRFLILTTALILLASAAAWFAFQRIAEGIVEQWGLRLAQTQVLYDRARLLQPLAREIALARQMASSLVLRRWAAAPDDSQARAQSTAELESFRSNFHDGSYFVALRDSGAFYFGDADNARSGDPLRYHLSPGNPKDQWFYEIVRAGRAFQLNVKTDEQLSLTKLWIAVPIRDGEAILGVAGTGLRLDAFIRDAVDTAQPGVTTLFVDRDGAIQLFRDPDLMNYDSVGRNGGKQKTLDLLFARSADRAALREAMRAVAAAPDSVASRFVELDGRRRLAGVAYLLELDWYEVTLLDLGVLIPIEGFAALAVIFAVALLVSLAVFNVLINRMVLGPLAALETAMGKVQQGDPGAAARLSGPGEIGSLMDHFARMAESIRGQTQQLEDKVQARTQALHLLARIDPLTELYNRRGMTELIEHEITRAERLGTSLGLLWLDIDYFKHVNDRFGHAEGDRVLTQVAALLRTNVRPYDSPGRWGGDEFLVLLPEPAAESVVGTAERIRAAVENGLPLPDGEPVTVSVGAHLAGPGEALETLLQRADQALYAAKAAGRNCVRRFGDPASAEAAH